MMWSHRHVIWSEECESARKQPKEVTWMQSWECVRSQSCLVKFNMISVQVKHGSTNHDVQVSL